MPTLHITDTRLAASLCALGFPGAIHTTVHTRTRQTQIEVRFSEPSNRFPALDAAALVQRWKRDRFADEPMHMLAVMMRAQAAYDAILKLQNEGGAIRLVADVIDATSGQPISYKYAPTDRFPVSTASIPPYPDLSLVACLAPLGIGITALLGSHGSHTYPLASQGLPITDSHGSIIRHRTVDLIGYAATGERRLSLEDTQPTHPLVIAYDAMHARQILKREIQRSQANLLVTASDGTAKQALIALNYKGHVGAAVSRHFKAPSTSLGL
jgi:hypothetical protein